MVTFGERLYMLRKEHGLRMQDVVDMLADEYGVKTHKGGISRWERDITEPSLVYLIALSKLYGVTLDYLVGLDENRTR